ncbi:MAG: hypothetical protein AB1801_03075 [Chloroflexota bacterium]
MEKAKAALKELDQTILILRDVEKKFNDSSLIEKLNQYDLLHLQGIHKRVRDLCLDIFGSHDSFDAWVGPMREFDKEQDRIQVSRLDTELVSRLFDFVQGFRHGEKVENELEHYVQENASLKRQLGELRKRESTYLSTLTKSKAPLSQESKDTLLKSLRSEEKTIADNISEMRQRKAKSGIDVPLDVINTLKQLEADLEEVLAKIAELQKQETSG